MQLDNDSIKILLRRSLKDFPNRNNVVDYLSKCLSTQDLAHYIRLIVADEKIRLFRKNDLVKFIPSNYKIDGSEYGAKDKLLDFLLYRKEYLYGIITDSDDYGSDFNPHYYKMQLNVAGLDPHNKFKIHKTTVETIHMILVSTGPQHDYITRLFETKKIDEDRFKT